MATYPKPFLRITFGGNIYGESDIWSCGINFAETRGDDPYPNEWLQRAQEVSDELDVTIANWFKDPEMGISKDASLTWVKAAWIGTDGLYLSDAGLTEVPEGTVGVNNAQIAPQLSTAITFETTRRRAPGKHGRIFPPMNVPSIGSNGHVPSTQADNMALRTSELLTAMMRDIDVVYNTTFYPIVASQKTDDHQQIVYVKVGDVVDTQRTRRNAFREIYTSKKAIAYPDSAE